MTGRQGLTIGAIKRRVLLWRWWHEREAEHWTNHDAARSMHAHNHDASRAGRDRAIHKALETVLALRGLSALTDAALEDLATQVVASEGAPRFDQNRFAAKREQGCVIFLDQYRFQRKN